MIRFLETADPEKWPRHTVRAALFRFRALDSLKLFEVGAGDEVAREPGVSVVDLGHPALDDATREIVVGALARRMTAAREETIKADRSAGRAPTGRSWLVVDEAHNFCPPGKRGYAFSELKALAARGRKRRCNFIFATQRPTAIHPDIRRLSNLNIVHRLVSKSDIQLAVEDMAFPGKDAQTLFRILPSGYGVVSDKAHGLRGALVEIRARRTRHGGAEPDLDVQAVPPAPAWSAPRIEGTSQDALLTPAGVLQPVGADPEEASQVKRPAPSPRTRVMTRVLRPPEKTTDAPTDTETLIPYEFEIDPGTLRPLPRWLRKMCAQEDIRPRRVHLPLLRIRANVPVQKSLLFIPMGQGREPRFIHWDLHHGEIVSAYPRSSHLQRTHGMFRYLGLSPSERAVLRALDASAETGSPVTAAEVAAHIDQSALLENLSEGSVRRTLTNLAKSKAAPMAAALAISHKGKPMRYTASPLPPRSGDEMAAQKSGDFPGGPEFSDYEGSLERLETFEGKPPKAGFLPYPDWSKNQVKDLGKEIHGVMENAFGCRMLELPPEYPARLWYPTYLIHSKRKGATVIVDGRTGRVDPAFRWAGPKSVTDRTAGIFGN